MKRRETSIKWKLFFSLLIFTAAALAAIWIFQVFCADTVYKTVKIREITDTAKKLSEHVNDDDFADTAQKTAEEKQICIVAFELGKRDMYQIVSADVLRNCAIHRISVFSKMKLYTAAVENGGENLERFMFDERTGNFYSVEGELFSKDRAASGEECIIYTSVTSGKDGKDIVLMLNSVISPLGTTVHAANVQMLCISVLLLILSLVLALILSGVISTPIIKLNDSAKLLANGKYDVDFNAKGYREISELGETLNATEKELEKTDRVRRELIANISHDLRTPLTMINGYAEIMRDIPGENNAENIQVIIDESKRLTTLINDVLDVSRLENGGENIRISQFDITESVRAMLLRYNTLIKNEGYEIEFLFDENISVKQDESKLLKVIYNLVNNAVTYTGDDKKVRVVQMLEGERVKYEVYDSGAGIEPDKLEYIWDRYYKVDKEHKRASVGSGLGLSIVRTVMEMLGGSYGVVTSPGNGSRFWVEFDREFKGETHD